MAGALSWAAAIKAGLDIILPSDEDKLRNMIQEELRLSKNEGNNEIYKEMLRIIEKSYSTQLNDVYRERDFYKAQVEMLVKLMEDLKNQSKDENKIISLVIEHASSLSRNSERVENKNHPKKFNLRTNSHQENIQNNPGRINSNRRVITDIQKNNLRSHSSGTYQQGFRHSLRRDTFPQNGSRSSSENTKKLSQENKNTWKSDFDFIPSSKDFEWAGRATNKMEYTNIFTFLVIVGLFYLHFN